MRTILLLLIGIQTFLFGQEIIPIQNEFYGLDMEKKLIVVNADVPTINQNYPSAKSEIVLSGENFVFSQPVDEIAYGMKYIVQNSGSDYDLYFSELPLIHLSTEGEISDTPKILGNFILSHPSFETIESLIGVEYRGAISQYYPKKSMEIEFWADENGDETEEHSLFGLRESDGWNLQAMYNEPMRINSKTSNDLWTSFHTIYYIDQEPEAKNGIAMKYAELFLNDQYFGVYGVGEKVNRSSLKLKKNQGDEIRGELYKGDSWAGGTNFNELIPFDNDEELWNGYEYKYPKDIREWENLYDLLDFIINSGDNSFNSQYASKLEINNMVDYFIFLNLLRATDNTGKNLHIARYDNDEPYYFVPWDLDGTFGTIWDGSMENVTDDILSNGLYDRLWVEPVFRTTLKNRWNALRTDQLTNESIHDLLAGSYEYLKRNAVYQREEMAWDEYEYDETYWTYMNTWLDQRLAFLDIEFNKELSVNDPIAKFEVSIYPNPVHNEFQIRSSSKILEILMYDLTGKLIRSIRPNDLKTSVNIEELPSGVYSVKIITEKGSKLTKLLKK